MPVKTLGLDGKGRLPIVPKATRIAVFFIGHGEVQHGEFVRWAFSRLQLNGLSSH